MSEILTTAQVLRHVADNLDAGRNSGHGLQIHADGKWEDIKSPVVVMHADEHRLKPRTRMLNGFEVPAPLDVMPEIGEEYWSVRMSGFNGAICFQCSGDRIDRRLFDRKMMFATKEDAVANFRAICGFDPNGEEQ